MIVKVKIQFTDQIIVQDARLRILAKGIIVPRLSEHRIISTSELLRELWHVYGFGFINHIKGTFIVYIHYLEEHRIYTDHFGLFKVFFQENDNIVIVSDNLDSLKSMRISTDSYAIFSLMHHHIGGVTPFYDTAYIKPSHYLQITDIVEQVAYWSVMNLVSLKQIDILSKDISMTFNDIVTQYIDAIKPRSIGLTLTGGYDSRIILAALLRCDANVSAYTYGDSDSIDNFIADTISREIGFRHFNYHLSDPSQETIDKYARLIINDSCGMSTLHRLHRFYAAQEFKKDESSVDLILTGHMGGEVMKGIFFDDLITSPYVRRRWNKEDGILLLREAFHHSFIKDDSVSNEEVMELINQEPYWSTDTSVNHVLFSFILKAGLHHSQDVALVSRNVAPCIPVFIDIDFLELLFKSKYSMLHNESMMRNPLKRIHAYEINCSMIMDLYPPLAKLPLGKRGMFTPEEYFGNKFILMMKRALRYRRNRGFKRTYSIGEWLRDYVRYCIPSMKETQMSHIIDFNKFSRELDAMKPGMPEKHWLRFTNAVLYYLLIRDGNEV